MECNITVFADYFQIYIEDSLQRSLHVPTFDSAEMSSMASISKGVIVIFTVRNLNVPLSIETLEIRPIVDFEKYDQVVECSIENSSGILSIMNAIHHPDCTFEIKMPLGNYGALICYAGLDTISSDGLEGEDEYKLFLWADESSLTKKVLKQWIGTGKST